MRKALKMLLCSALLLIAALFSFSAFTSASSAHAATLTPSIAASSCPATVREGSTGSAVRLAQESLNWWEENSNFQWSTAPGLLTVDGDFGPKTKQEVIDFQEWYSATYHVSLTVDGIVGPKTWHALGHC